MEVMVVDLNYRVIALEGNVLVPTTLAEAKVLRWAPFDWSSLPRWDSLIALAKAERAPVVRTASLQQNFRNLFFLHHIP